MAEESGGAVASLFAKIGFQMDEKSVRDANKSINTFRSNASRLLGALGLGFSIMEIKRIDEEFKRANDSIRAMVGSMKEAVSTQKELNELANGARMSYTAIASMATKMAQVNPKLYGSVSEAAKEIELVTKLGKAYGYSEGEISSMQSVISGLASQRVMSGGQIKSLESTAPELVKLIAQAKGLSIQELEAYANAGILSAKEIKDILISSEEEINARFEKIDITISDALKEERNSWGLMISQADQEYKITENIAKAIKIVSGEVRFIVNLVLKIVGPVFKLFDKLGISEHIFAAIVASLTTILGLVTAIKAVDLASHVGEILKNLNGVVKILGPLKSLVSGGKLISTTGTVVKAGTTAAEAAGGTAAAGGAAAGGAAALGLPEIGLIVLGVLLTIGTIALYIKSITAFTDWIKQHTEKKDIKEENAKAFGDNGERGDLVEYMMIVQDLLNKKDREHISSTNGGNVYYYYQNFDTNMEFGGTNASAGDIEKTSENAFARYARNLAVTGT